jgi:hypothetical protein
MDRIIKSYSKSFATEQLLEHEPESKQFELFANFCVVHGVHQDRFDPLLVTTEPPEAGIDGIAFVLDESLVSTREEAEDIFARKRGDVSARLVFVQAKTSEPLKRDEVLKFSDAVKDFVSATPKHAMGATLTEARAIFDLVIEKVGRISGGRPDCFARFVTTGSADTTGVGWVALQSLKDDLIKTGLFNHVDVLHVHKDELIRLWSSTKQKPEAKLDVRGLAAFPSMKGVTEAYIAIVPAKSFIESVLTDEQGGLRSYIFDENVRAFLGENTAVNGEIAATLKDLSRRDRFSILNNGITLISPDVRVQGSALFMRDFQIVNGCQTSHVLFQHRDDVDESVMVTARVVEVDDPEIVGEVIRATNNQTEIDDVQFLSLKPIVRKVEAYFNARGAEHNSADIKLYFERRSRQFAGQGIPDFRVFDIKDVCRAVAAMYLERPDLAARYPTQMFDELSDGLLNADNQESPYFAAALALYKVHAFVASARLPTDFRKFKWHFLLCLKYAIAGATNPPLTDRRVNAFSDKIVTRCRSADTKEFDLVVEAINSLGPVDRDKLKTSAFISDLKKALFSRLPKQT